jgi:hypothetical protein
VEKSPKLWKTPVEKSEAEFSTGVFHRQNPVIHSFSTVFPQAKPPFQSGPSRVFHRLEASLLLLLLINIYSVVIVVRPLGGEL